MTFTWRKGFSELDEKVKSPQKIKTEKWIKKKSASLSTLLRKLEWWIYIKTLNFYLSENCRRNHLEVFFKKNISKFVEYLKKNIHYGQRLSCACKVTVITLRDFASVKKISFQYNKNLEVYLFIMLISHADTSVVGVSSQESLGTKCLSPGKSGFKSMNRLLKSIPLPRFSHLPSVLP